MLYALAIYAHLRTACKCHHILRNCENITAKIFRTFIADTYEKAPVGSFYHNCIMKGCKSLEVRDITYATYPKIINYLRVEVNWIDDGIICPLLNI